MCVGETKQMDPIKIINKLILEIVQMKNDVNELREK